MSAPDLGKYNGCTPVLVDDIVSSGTTARQALRLLREQNFDRAYYLAVHALSAARTARHIRDSSLGFITSNTVENPDAVLDVAPIIADALIAQEARSSSSQVKMKKRLCSR